jgi:hypothetical protein
MKMQHWPGSEIISQKMQRKVEIHKMEMLSIENVAFPAGGDGGRKAA